MAFEAVPKVLLYAATLVAIGLATTQWIVPAAITRGWTERDRAALAAMRRTLALGAAGVAVLAVAGRALGHTMAIFGPDALTWDNLTMITLESRWGDGWRAQTWASIALLGAATATAIGRGGRVSWLAFAAVAVVLATTIPRLGHAAGDATRQLLHTVHLLGSGAWLGGLAALVAIALRIDPARRGTIVSRFSPVALGGASVAAVTGVIASVLYVGSTDHLGTPYARALVVKLLLFAGVVACGRLNWRRARAGQPPRLALMLAELALAAGIVGVTGILTELEHP